MVASLALAVVRMGYVIYKERDKLYSNKYTDIYALLRDNRRDMIFIASSMLVLFVMIVSIFIIGIAGKGS
jgi:hypothetical protein